jgi:ribosomal protein S18 acetylase RimI-like enzyme
MDSDFEIRRVTAGDWADLRELRLEALKDAPLAFVEQYDEALAQPPGFWQARVARGATGTEAATFVAVGGGRFVGKATGLREDAPGGPATQVVGVYVTPAWRGRRPGVATALLERVIRWAREEAGTDPVRLVVMETNAPAFAFYRRLGFVPTGRTMAYPPDPAYLEHELEYRPAGLS